MDVATAAEVAAEGPHRWHDDPDPGVLLETVGFDRGVSGQDGKRVDDPAYVDGAAHVIDLICDNLAPCGTFWGTWYREHGWSQSWTPTKGWAARPDLGQATLSVGRALAAHPGAPSWDGACVSDLDAIAGRGLTAVLDRSAASASRIGQPDRSAAKAADTRNRSTSIRTATRIGFGCGVR